MCQGYTGVLTWGYLLQCLHIHWCTLSFCLPCQPEVGNRFKLKAWMKKTVCRSRFTEILNTSSFHSKKASTLRAVLWIWSAKSRSDFTSVLFLPLPLCWQVLCQHKLTWWVISMASFSCYLSLTSSCWNKKNDLSDVLFVFGSIVLPQFSWLEKLFSLPLSLPLSPLFFAAECRKIWEGNVLKWIN